MKTKILADFQICISVPLRLRDSSTVFSSEFGKIFNNACIVENLWASISEVSVLFEGGEEGGLKTLEEKYLLGVIEFWREIIIAQSQS